VVSWNERAGPDRLAMCIHCFSVAVRKYRDHQCLKEERKVGRMEGKKEGRKKGRKEGRKERRKDLFI
jgi:predicted transposase YdaD